MEPDIEIKTVDEYPHDAYRDLVERNLNSNGIVIESEANRSGAVKSTDDPGRIRVGAFDGERLVGLSWGGPTGARRFMMHISLVDSAYRGRGIYSKMLRRMLEETRDFDEVDSTHQLFNNHIIAIKLRQGFYIIGVDQSIVVGPRVLMRYFHRQENLELMRYRVGLRTDPRVS